MKDISDTFKNLKKTISKKEGEYGEVNDLLTSFFIFQFKSNINDLLISFYIKNHTLTLESKNKVIAQELHIYLSELKKILPEFIKDIRVK